MIIRIVQMTFRQEAVADFMALFEERKSMIRGFAGCSHLELWQDSRNPCVLFTLSHWDSEQYLDHYRFSAFFKDTWGRTKQLFAAAPQAWSLVQLSGC